MSLDIFGPLDWLTPGSTWDRPGAQTAPQHWRRRWRNEAWAVRSPSKPLLGIDPVVIFQDAHSNHPPKYFVLDY